MQKRASAVKNWIACKIDQPRVVKSFGTLGRNSTPRANGQRRLVCASLSTGISLFAPSSLFSIPRADIDPTAGCPLITLYHACTCRFLAHGRQNIILDVEHDARFSIEKLCFQDGIFFITENTRISSRIQSRSSIIRASLEKDVLNFVSSH